jgi:drug/metabolite transporter (DMT)-like permease
MWVSWSVLTVGVLAASISAILVRYASEDAQLESWEVGLAISFWRSAVGALVLAPFAFKRARPSARDIKLSTLAGFFLALHFATWITSLELTSVASSVLLVSTTPIFVAALAWFFFRERLGRVGWAGIALAVGGSGLIGAAGGTEDSSFLGDMLALAGGAAGGAYLLAGARARIRLGIIQYAVIAYGVSAVLLLPICLIAAVPLTGYPAQTWWAMAGIVIGPQLLGHTLINFVLDDIDPTTVSMTIMAEPVIAAALAYFLLSETPSRLVFPGGAAILLGIYLITVVSRRPAEIIE